MAAEAGKRSCLVGGLLAGAILAAVCIGAGAAMGEQRSNRTLVSGGRTRAYHLFAPAGVDGSRPVPLVISLHGFAGWPVQQMHVSGWNRLAEQYGFLVVYPSGTGIPKRWGVRDLEGNDVTPDEEIAFFEDLIAALSGEFRIDPARIYVNGLSNGGGMSVLLSCRLAEKIAAIGTVAGAMVTPWEECHPSRPVPMISFHGTADPIVPFHGGLSSGFEFPFPDVPTWMREMAHRNGCDPGPVTLAPSGAVQGVAYRNCREGADVEFYSVDGGGHTWPGGQPMPDWITGPTSPDIDASAEMWRFFTDHPLR